MQSSPAVPTAPLSPLRLARRPAALAATFGTAGVLLAGCGDGADDPAAESEVSVATDCAPPSPAPTVTGPLAAFDLEGLAVPTRAAEEDGYFVVNAQAAGEIPDLAISFQQVVEDAGYDIAGMDDEGFEAEVFFAAGTIAAGQVVLTESDCAGLVDVKITLLDDEAVVPEGDGSETPLDTPATS